MSIDDMPVAKLYPGAPLMALREEYVGMDVRSVPPPAPILDVAVIRRNCKYMLQTVERLGVSFRAHVKTHKTVELAKLQVGEHSRDIRLLASTVAEIEHLIPWLSTAKNEGKKVNIIYGLPIAPSLIERLAPHSHRLGPGSITLLVDNAAQLEFLAKFSHQWAGPIALMIKIDTGYHRAGIPPDSSSLQNLVHLVTSHPSLVLAGIYTHMGHSYSSSSPVEAQSFLKAELQEALQGARKVSSCLKEPPPNPLIISIGATPTVTAAQDLRSSPQGSEVEGLINHIKESFQLELYAGVYPVLDMQQLATAARPEAIDSATCLTSADISLRILVEVVSVYDEREKPEALIAAGSIVLGREPCKSYPGWGVVTGWRDDGETADLANVYDPARQRNGWIVGRISQEHGILTLEGDQSSPRTLRVGEKIMVWPNHACMAGPNFGWYYVVDSDSKDPDVIREIWGRCRGW